MLIENRYACFWTKMSNINNRIISKYCHDNYHRNGPDTRAKKKSQTFVQCINNLTIGCKRARNSESWWNYSQPVRICRGVILFIGMLHQYNILTFNFLCKPQLSHIYSWHTLHICWLGSSCYKPGGCSYHRIGWCCNLKKIVPHIYAKIARSRFSVLCLLILKKKKKTPEVLSSFCFLFKLTFFSITAWRNGRVPCSYWERSGYSIRFCKHQDIVKLEKKKKKKKRNRKTLQNGLCAKFFLKSE